jgi:peptidoglycan/LPS O-acetylase OafA/YrhL
MTEVAVGGLERAADTGREATRFPCFDGFRAAAAFAVLVLHVAYASGETQRNESVGLYLARLDIGVAVFFLISGFLLYRPFVSAQMSGRRGPAVLPFYVRRFLRIYPAYWLATTAVVYIFHTWPGGTISGVKNFVLFYTLTHSYNLDTIFAPLLQAWTLATEVAFYLFLPAWALFMRRVALASSPVRRLRVELAGLAGLVCISFAYRMVVLTSISDDTRVGQLLMWLPAWLDLFAMGMVLAVARVWLNERGRRAPLGLERLHAPTVCWALAAFTFWIVSTQLGISRDTPGFTTAQDVGVHYLYGLTAFFFLLPGVFGPQDEGLVRRLLRNRVVQAAGVVSYGIYLWHENWIAEFFDWRDVPVFSGHFWPLLASVVVLTVASATVSWMAVERPLLRLKPRATHRATVAP